MLTRRVRIQVAAFIIIAAVGVSWLGIRYVGLATYIHNTGYETTLNMPAAGGLFTNAEVTYRGNPVGKVKSLQLTSTGVRATLAIKGGSPKIPADASVVVADRSVIGEQYVDLRPASDSGPYLKDGSVLTVTAADLPISVNTVLADTRDFVASVPLGDLRTVVDELYLATQGAHDPLRQLISTSAQFAATANDNIGPTSSLIQSSSTVLATQEQSAGSIRSFSRSLRQLSGTLKGSNKDFDTLLTTAPGAARQLDALFTRVGQPLGVVLSNLVSPAQVFGTNSDSVRGILLRVPQAIDDGYAATGPNGVKGTLVTNLFNPLPCTLGYQDTPERSGLDTSAGQPLSLTVGGCTPGSQPASQGTPSQSKNPVTVTTPSDLAGLLGGQ